jgi:hypothetical protein
MKSEELLIYIMSQIQLITDKYKKINVCNVGEKKLCNNHPLVAQKPGTGCCTTCQFHDINIGCTIYNLCCMSYFCDAVKDKIEPADWIKLKSTLIILQGFGLGPRETWNQQIRTFERKRMLLDCTIDDFYNIFKRIFEDEK